MPQLPIHQTQQSRTTQSGGRSSQAGVIAAKALQGFGETIEKIGDVWMKAHVTNQYTTAKNENQAEINQLMADADGELDHTEETRKIYLDRLNEISSRDISIDDIDVKAKFDSDNNLFMDEAKISIEGKFKQKMIAHQRIEITKDGDLSKQQYITAFSTSKGELIVNGYIDRLKAYKDSGFISEKEYASEIEGVKGWNVERATYDIGKNPALAAQGIEAGAYGNLNVKQKNELVNLAKASIDRQKKVREMAQLSNHTKNETDLLVMIYTDPTKSLAEKTLTINEFEANNGISEGFAADSRRLLKSVEKQVDESFDVNETGDLLKLFPRDVQGTLEGQKGKEYMERLQVIRKAVLQNEAISRDNKILIVGELQRMGEVQTMKEGRGNRWNNAHKYFKEQLPSSMVNKAMVKALKRFTAIEKKMFTKQELVPLLRSIGSEVMVENRKLVDDMFELARKRIPNKNADLRYAVDKNGNVSIQYFPRLEGGRAYRKKERKRLLKPITVVQPQDLEDSGQ